MKKVFYKFPYLNKPFRNVDLFPLNDECHRLKLKFTNKIILQNFTSFVTYEIEKYWYIA